MMKIVTQENSKTLSAILTFISILHPGCIKIPSPKSELESILEY